MAKEKKTLQEQLADAEAAKKAQDALVRKLRRAAKAEEEAERKEREQKEREAHEREMITQGEFYTKYVLPWMTETKIAQTDSAGNRINRSVRDWFVDESKKKSQTVNGGTAGDE